MNELEQTYRELVDNIPKELHNTLARYSLKLCQAQKKLDCNTFKLVNIRDIKGEAWIKVENAQDDILDGSLVFNFKLYLRNNI